MRRKSTKCVRKMSFKIDVNKEEKESDNEFYDANENANEERAFVRECSSNESDNETTAEQLAKLKNEMENFIIDDHLSNQTAQTSRENEKDADDNDEKDKPVNLNP